MKSPTLGLLFMVLVWVAFGWALFHPPWRHRRRTVQVIGTHSRGYDLYMRSGVWRARRWCLYHGRLPWRRRCDNPKCRQWLALHGGGWRAGMSTHHRRYRRRYWPWTWERRRNFSLFCTSCHMRQDAWRHR